MTTLNQDLPLLETILRELDAALAVCDRQGYIRFCNPAARSLFRHHPGLALGGSLYAVCQRGPIAHTLRLLAQRDHDHPAGGGQDEVRLACTTVDNALLLDCRIRPLAIPGAAEPLVLFTFAALDRQLAGQEQAGGLLPELIDDLRRPLSNLAAAAANLRNHPEMNPESRRAFVEIVAQESTALTDRFDTLVWQYRATFRQPWPLSDVHSADLFGSLVQRLAGGEGPVVTMTGEPLWLRGDSYSLLLALEAMVRFVQQLRRVPEIKLEALLGDQRVYLDLVWPGAPIPQAALNQLLQSPLPEGGNGVTIAEVLWRHDSELWSQRHQQRGFALLRLPLPHSQRQWQGTAEDEGAALALAARPLAELEYVVFDTETTGPDPAGGGEIMAIAAVRVGPGKILGSERFESLVKPRQPMPAAATSLLAISGAMVERAAPLAEVLPQFRAFVGEAVLVGHNASFDLGFFRSQAGSGGVRFDRPLLDTLLLSRLVAGHRNDPTLAGLADWLGVAGAGSQDIRETCLATARIFLRLLDRLAEQGVTTLGQVLAASARLLEQPPAASGAGGRDA